MLALCHSRRMLLMLTVIFKLAQSNCFETKNDLYYYFETNPIYNNLDTMTVTDFEDIISTEDGIIGDETYMVQNSVDDPLELEVTISSSKVLMNNNYLDGIFDHKYYMRSEVCFDLGNATKYILNINITGLNAFSSSASHTNLVFGNNYINYFDRSETTTVNNAVYDGVECVYFSYDNRFEAISLLQSLYIRSYGFNDEVYVLPLIYINLYTGDDNECDGRYRFTTMDNIITGLDIVSYEIVEEPVCVFRLYWCVTKEHCINIGVVLGGFAILYYIRLKEKQGRLDAMRINNRRLEIQYGNKVLTTLNEKMKLIKEGKHPVSYELVEAIRVFKDNILDSLRSQEDVYVYRESELGDMNRKLELEIKHLQYNVERLGDILNLILNVVNSSDDEALKTKARLVDNVINRFNSQSDEYFKGLIKDTLQAHDINSSDKSMRYNTRSDSLRNRKNIGNNHNNRTEIDEIELMDMNSTNNKAADQLEMDSECELLIDKKKIEVLVDSKREIINNVNITRQFDDSVAMQLIDDTDHKINDALEKEGDKMRKAKKELGKLQDVRAHDEVAIIDHTVLG